MPHSPPSSGAELAAFFVFAAIAIVGALITVIARSPIRAAVGLFFHIVSLAMLYLNLGAHFVGVIQLLVYAGAVVVLFVFVIMLLGPASTTARDSRNVLPRIAAVIAIGGIGSAIVWAVWFLRPELPLRTAEYGTLEQIGMLLFTRAAVPFELLGLLLVIAVVGAFAIGRGHHHRQMKAANPAAPRTNEEGDK